MSGPMKARRISSGVSIQVGDRKKRMFLVPKDQAEAVVLLLKNFEVEANEPGSYREPVQDILDRDSEPGVALRGARVKEGISQTELASKLGIPPSNISEMESGKRPIGKKMAKRLSKALTVDYRLFI